MRIKDKNSIREILAECKVTPSENLENEEVEFKEYKNIKSLHNESQKLAEEISALANWKGGIIIVGVKDSNNVDNMNWGSQLVGFESGDVIEIQQRIKGNIKPYFDIMAEYLDFETKDYLVIHVPQRRDSLITTASGKTCIRDGRSSRPMNPDEIRQAVTNLRNYDWSADILELDVFSSLNPVAIDEAYEDHCNRKKYSPESKPDKNAFLEAIGATSNGFLTKSGLLFLGKSVVIKKWLGVYEYRFSWKTRTGQLIINEVREECIWNSVKLAKKCFGVCNVKLELKFRDKTYQVPILDDIAFHEAFINAIVHRDYSIDGMISVDFDSTEMIITNPGNFYGGVTSDNIAIHHPRHRNKALAKLMMEFQLVDRAGMGVKRMGLGSLMYGREFPKFQESFNSVEVIMQAESVLPGIFVVTQKKPDNYGLIDLIIINSLYRKGAISVNEVIQRVSGVSKNGWLDVKESVERIEQVELCGNKDGIFIRVNPTWNEFFEIRKAFFVQMLTSEKHVKLYEYLMEVGEASNEDITYLLGHKNSTYTSAFLRKSKYVYRTGKSRSSRWFLKN